MRLTVLWKVSTDSADIVGTNVWTDELEFTANQSLNSTEGYGLKYSICDLWVQDYLTAPNQGSLWPAIITPLRPDAESAQIDFTPSTGADNSVLVGEDILDYDSSYNEANVAADKDRLTTTDEVNAQPVGSVLCAQVSSVMKDTADTGTRTVRNVIKSGTTEENGATATLTESGWQSVDSVHDENPDTTAAWTRAEVEAAEFGYEIVS